MIPLKPRLLFCISTIIISIHAMDFETPTINSLTQTFEKFIIEYTHSIQRIGSFVCILFSLNIVCQIFIIVLGIMHYNRR